MVKGIAKGLTSSVQKKTSKIPPQDFIRDHFLFDIIAVYIVITKQMGLKYKVDEKFFNTWTEEMAYMLGYIYADGSLEDARHIRGKYIRVSSTDKIILEKFKRWLRSEHKIISVPPSKSLKSFKNTLPRYLLRIGNHNLYNGLIRHGLYPKKSLTIHMPSIPKKFFSHFVRGYFDGDGCVHLYTTKGKVQKRVVRRLTVIFTSGSFIFLHKLNEVLRATLNLKQQKIYPHSSKNCYQLRYSTEDTLKLFDFFYKKCNMDTCLERKLVVFKNYFVLRPAKITRVVQNILHRSKSMAT